MCGRATLTKDDGPDREQLAARARDAGVAIAEDDTWGDIFSRILVEKVEPRLCDGRATILAEYPAELAALARPKPFDPRVAERFELYACGVELANAFGELYDCFVERVYRYLYFRTGSHPEAEDLTEQVFLKAWEAIGRYRWQGRPFLAWLYRLAHNTHIDHVRSHKPTMSLNSDERPVELASSAASVELARALDADLIARALAQLTPDQRQVIVMKFIEGLDNEQIAQSMDKREGAIRALQMRALMSLRRVLESQGENGST